MLELWCHTQDFETQISRAHFRVAISGCQCCHSRKRSLTSSVVHIICVGSVSVKISADFASTSAVQ